MANPDAERIMRSGEIDFIGFEFIGDDIANCSISSGTVSVSPATGLNVDSPDAIVTADQKGLYQWVTAVSVGEYDVSFAVNFTDGKKLIRVYRVRVI